jgi:hypothetical protein
MTTETKQHQLEWRRSQVVELASMGYSQREIARILQIDLSAVTRDIRFLRQQAQENIKNHIQQRMPEEYHIVGVSINHVLKKASHIANSTADERIRLQALSLIRECDSNRLEMITNGTVVSDALKYVNAKAEKLGQQVKAEEYSASAFDYESESESEEKEGEKL